MLQIMCMMDNNMLMEGDLCTQNKYYFRAEQPFICLMFAFSVVYHEYITSIMVYSCIVQPISYRIIRYMLLCWGLVESK